MLNVLPGTQQKRSSLPRPTMTVSNFTLMIHPMTGFVLRRLQGTLRQSGLYASLLLATTWCLVQMIARYVYGSDYQSINGSVSVCWRATRGASILSVGERERADWGGLQVREVTAKSMFGS